jgi:hypothetical protein
MSEIDGFDWGQFAKDIESSAPVQVCNNCDLPTPKDELREYCSETYFCEICYKEFTMTDEEIATRGRSI